MLIVDDQRVVREGLSMLLGLIDGLDVVAVAADGDEAITQVEESDPDVVLMDLNMPRTDGIEATRRLAISHPHLPVIVLTTYTDDERVFAALRAGARGYLTKDAGAAEIEAAITAATAGKVHLDPDVQRRLLETLRSGAAFGIPDGDPVEPSGRSAPAQGASAAPGTAPDGLTRREVEVFQQIAEGRSNAEIAANLYVSEATVKTHINHIFAKTGVRDRAQLVAYAFRTGVAGPPS
ncbi:response regulator transcription factor [Terrabacter aeriphilus]|uniref:response regulator transcription factor n=1 Tax=Terrabacter aeriphilus TaxID=515662 RepID=UPI0031E9821B